MFREAAAAVCGNLYPSRGSPLPTQRRSELTDKGRGIKTLLVVSYAGIMRTNLKLTADVATIIVIGAHRFIENGRYREFRLISNV